MYKVTFILNGTIDEWLSSLGLTLDDFFESMVGSWIFGYAKSLKLIGVETTIIAVARIPHEISRIHAPTGSKVILVPPSWVGRRVLPLIDRLLQVVLPERISNLVMIRLKDELQTPIFALSRICQRNRYDTIIVQEYETTRFDLVTLLGKYLGVPVFGTFTGAYPKSSWSTPLKRISMRLMAGLVICSSYEISRVQKVYGLGNERVLKLYYPIDLRIWDPEERALARHQLGLPMKATIAIYHGSISIECKGLDLLLEAWQQADPEDALLLIIGDGEDATRLASLIGGSGRTDIRFIRRWEHDTAHLRRYLSAADFYVFPSRFDSFGISVLEAMACGLPVIAARSRGIMDIFPAMEGSGGLVVNQNDVDALTSGIEHMISDQTWRQQLANAARLRVRSTDFDVGLADRLLNFLRVRNNRT